jgi:hypothetical protein
MKRFSEQIQSQAAKVRMSAAEKRDLQNRLVTFMEYHPLPAAERAVRRPGKSAVQQSPFFILKVPARYMQSFSIVTALLVLVVMPVMAERSVPGDVLYPVKVRINEEVVSSFNRTAYDKVEWETKRLERRLAEARVLASSGKLTAEVEADVVAAVRQHTTDAANTIAALRVENSEQATLAEITLATRLGLQESLLQTTLAAGTSTDGVSVEGIAAAVSEGQIEAAEREGLATISFENLLASLERETTRLYELLESLESNADAQAVADVDRRIKDVERRIKESVFTYTEQPEASMAALREIWKDAQKLVSYSTDLDVRATLSLEALVPVVLTPDERLVALEEGYVAVRSTYDALVAGYYQVSDAAVAEKVTMSLPGIQTALLLIETQKNSDLPAAEASLAEQQAVLESILGMVTLLPIENATSTPDRNDVEIATTTATTTDVAEVSGEEGE